MGFARVTETPAGPVRTRQVYRITAAGRRVLKRWLESEPAPPQLEFEAVLRLFYADATDKDNVLSALTHTHDELQQRYAEGMLLVDAWLGGEAPFPERLHISALVAAFTRDLLLLMIQWSEFARARNQAVAENRRSRHDPADTRPTPAPRRRAANHRRVSSGTAGPTRFG